MEIILTAITILLLVIMLGFGISKSIKYFKYEEYFIGGTWVGLSVIFLTMLILFTVLKIIGNIL